MTISLVATTCGNATADESVPSDLIASAFRRHCVECHGDGDTIEGDVDLSDLNLSRLSNSPELVANLIDVLDLQEMPPNADQALDPESRQNLVTELKSILHTSVTTQDRFAATPIRRMNRFQYNNAVIDLFGLDCIVFTLPERMMRDHKNYFRPETGKMADLVNVGSRPLGKSQMIEPRLAGVAAFPQDLRAEHGYDNRGDHLSLSPLLMESFLKLGQSITQSPDFVASRVGIWQSFFAPPDNTDGVGNEVRRRLEPFLTKAFRRSVTPEQLERYASFVDARLARGASFTDAMKSVAAATIASPNFLYLYDKSSGEQPTGALDDFELASRLSFFLWGSLPDEQLLDLAGRGILKRPDVLDRQFDRMVNDRKLKRFCDSFPAQWLQLERIISSVPDEQRFPKFYFAKYRDSMHMMLEPLLLFETVLIENLPITQLIDSDFSYRSVTLEDAYGDLRSESPMTKGGGGAPTVLKFHRIPLADRRTGGVITNAAVMTMTSGPDRSHPITRGAWVATVIFNNPPDPPPADVPALGEKPADGEENLTLRERLSLHRQRSDCKGCHEQIDPLGFALENFDAIGQWRDQYENGRDVDMAGTLMRQHEFNDVVQFKDAILVEKDRFTRALAGHLLSFALARQLGPADQITLDEITGATIDDDYKIQTLLKMVIMSAPFQTKSTPANSPVAP
ncbi:DUF1592 domain-containing protein [Rubripirellula reticaptiva]|uniref:DUF1592 domain-containing protein n=1 Tax=Rubripirellula reticaptiva TaxID=2528013 RepID=UPI001FE51622|nr:DUF1592 domain-containing protein [Rubripirellula reticaptiva]